MTRRALLRIYGGVYLVEVLLDEENDSDEGLRRTLKLRCLGTEKPSLRLGDIEIGREFEASVRRGHESDSSWTIEYLP